MAAQGNTDDYRVRLIELADAVARTDLADAAGLSGNEDLYLSRFRAAYQHMASSVDRAPGSRQDEKPLPTKKTG